MRALRVVLLDYRLELRDTLLSGGHEFTILCVFDHVSISNYRLLVLALLLIQGGTADNGGKPEYV